MHTLACFFVLQLCCKIIINATVLHYWGEIKEEFEKKRGYMNRVICKYTKKI